MSDEIRMTLLHHSTNDLIEELLMWKGLAAEHLDRIAELEKRTAELHYANTACMEMKHELDRLNAEIKTTDDLLKEATETIGAVIACCTYNSNDDAKIGIYGIDQNAFTKIDQFITHYNDAVSAGKVSVDVKRDLSDAEIEELGAREAESRGDK